MNSFKENEASAFLKKIGLLEYVDELVIKHKFNTIDDLKMLTDLEDNIFKSLNLPLCVILKIRKEFLNLPQSSEGCCESSPTTSTSLNLQVKDDASVEKMEISKTKLLELQKTSLDAQYANVQYNKFTSLLASRVSEYQLENKWQGSGGLRVSAGTSAEQANQNFMLAQSIINEADASYAVHQIPGHGVVTLDRKKARAFIGNKLSHMRKPSAYKSKGIKNTRQVKNVRKKTVDQPTGSSTAICGNTQESESHQGTITTSKGVDESQEVNIETNSMTSPSNEDEEGCEYLKLRKQNIEENERQMVKLGLLSTTQATIIALFFIGFRQQKDVQMKKIREVCKKQNVTMQKTNSKQQLLIMLGKKLFETKEVQIKDNLQPMCYGNLKKSDECKA